MSGDNNVSGGSISPEDKKALDSFYKISADSFTDYVKDPENIKMIKSASTDVQDKFRDKCLKNSIDCTLDASGSFTPGSMAGQDKAPATIKEQTKSEPLPPPESGDIQYFDRQERIIGDRINTLDTRLLIDHDAGENHPGPWVEFCHGRDAETRKLMVERVPAKEEKILPYQVMHYRGSVVMDHNAVHSSNVLIGKERRMYVFDRFFFLNGKRFDRCALVEDRKHQAGLMYEKWVPKNTAQGFSAGKAYARVRRIPKTESPMYEVLGFKETDYRDLKRLFERYFLNRGDVIQDSDPALKELFRAMPLVATE